jgi:TetR/AcrR family transcriptional repressor of lmrAB and yxaGH operons
MKKGERTRQRMIDATATLLQSHGYAGTGMAQILEASGAPRGSLYFHFPGGKEELAAAAVRKAGTDWREAIMAAVDGAPNIPAGIIAACQLLADDLLESDFAQGCPVATVALEASPHSEALHAACAECFGAWHDLIVARLVALGLPSPQAVPLSTACVAMIEGAIVLCKARRSVEPLEHVGLVLGRMLAAFVSV